MKPLFADTSFFVAVLNERDVFHSLADQLSRQFSGPVITSHWILLELANYFAARQKRSLVPVFIDSLLSDPMMQCEPANAPAFTQGLELYRQRPDKTWSLTDCLSFQIMQRLAISQVLSSDHHFEQAGFEILLKKQ
jgi:predicted nucleic acid-binding protein